jgi:hypothetical protein
VVRVESGKGCCACAAEIAKTNEKKMEQYHISILNPLFFLYPYEPYYPIQLINNKYLLSFSEMSGKVEKSGWLHKQGEQRKSWKKRFMKLCGQTLYYYPGPKVRSFFFILFFYCNYIVLLFMFYSPITKKKKRLKNRKEQ